MKLSPWTKGYRIHIKKEKDAPSELHHREEETRTTSLTKVDGRVNRQPGQNSRSYRHRRQVLARWLLAGGIRQGQGQPRAIRAKPQRCLAGRKPTSEPITGNSRPSRSLGRSFAPLVVQRDRVKRRESRVCLSLSVQGLPVAPQAVLISLYNQLTALSSWLFHAVTAQLNRSAADGLKRAQPQTTRSTEEAKNKGRLLCRMRLSEASKWTFNGLAISPSSSIAR
ncbi:hypothetical protein H101_07030 [Trichophyton interdigitale H6]|nr:hypothetical protein H101_07030 [Trichophyton interdigitale H6]